MANSLRLGDEKSKTAKCRALGLGFVDTARNLRSKAWKRGFPVVHLPTCRGVDEMTESTLWLIVTGFVSLEMLSRSALLCSCSPLAHRVRHCWLGWVSQGVQLMAAAAIGGLAVAAWHFHLPSVVRCSIQPVLTQNFQMLKLAPRSTSKVGKPTAPAKSATRAWFCGDDTLVRTCPAWDYTASYPSTARFWFLN